MAEQYSVVCICHVLFGHLGRFHVLAAVNNAAVYTSGCMNPCQLAFSSDKYPAVELLACKVVPFLIF